ncbi:964_t:CDS:2, partial [Dentiscutata heterogama]
MTPKIKISNQSNEKKETDEIETPIYTKEFFENLQKFNWKHLECSIFQDAFNKRSLEVVINSKTRKIHQEQKMSEKDKQKNKKIKRLESAVQLLLKSNSNVAPE